LDGRYFLYFEDIDFCTRAKKAGFKIFYIPQGFLWHKNAVASGGSGSGLQTYYYIKSRLIFGLRFAPFKTKLALIRESVKFLLKGNKEQKRAIIDFCFGRFGERK
jgi:hypothetical protein